MFFITFSSLWNFSIFFLFTYLTIIISLISYILPIITSNTKYAISKDKTNFWFLNGFDLQLVFLTPYILYFLMTNLWVAPTISSWFGHIVFTSFQMKMSYFIILIFIIVTSVLLNTIYFSSRESYDYVIVTFNFMYWISVLFWTNTIFTTIFVIEVLSTLIFLLIITSTFSSGFFYRNLDLSFGHLFQQTTPTTYLQSILYFFWISLISSLNLFLFFLLMYVKLLTLDWYLMEYIFIYYVSISSIKDIFTLGISWFIMIFCIFLKCGIVPLFIWKPTFFKGIPLYTLFFYICFFYFFLFLFLIHFLTSYFSEIFYFFTIVNIIFIVTGLVFLLFIMCESYYFKAFMAISSILNSLFVILALSTTHSVDLYFWL